MKVYELCMVMKLLSTLGSDFLFSLVGCLHFLSIFFLITSDDGRKSQQEEEREWKLMEARMMYAEKTAHISDNGHLKTLTLASRSGI
jgi:hypothetical protein